jgi:hypothetical protein
MAGKETLTRHTKALGRRLGIWIWVRQDYIVIRGWFNEMRWMDGRNTRGGVRVKVYIDSVNDNGRVQDLKHILFSRDLEKKSVGCSPIASFEFLPDAFSGFMIPSFLKMGVSCKIRHGQTARPVRRLCHGLDCKRPALDVACFSHGI